MAAQTALEYCCSQIERARERSISGRYFVQEAAVRGILSPEIVTSAVTEISCDDHERIGLAKSIQQEGIITFAILIWRRRADFIVNFRNHESLDSRLPISEAQAKEIVPDFGASFAREYQWEFLPYVFRQDMNEHHRHISSPGMILPFIGEQVDIAEGGFGAVSRLEIPVGMQQFPLSAVGNSVKVMRKRIKPGPKQTKSQYDKSFTREMACLRLLGRLNHPNIVPLLGSYTFKGVHNLLFPCFDMDLEGFFLTNSRFGDFRWNSNFHRALSGIASALEHTHNLRVSQVEDGLDVDFIGYHYDLRPANILVSRASSTFVLADFGLGSLKPAQAGSKTMWKYGAGDYIAPECMDTELVHQNVGRTIDVWAFGCLTTEVLIYMERGLEGLNLFRKSRWAKMMAGLETTYFYGVDGMLKPSVVRWVENISNESSSSTAETLRLALSALEPNPQRRPRIAELRRGLSLHSLRLLLQELSAVFSDYVQRCWPGHKEGSANMQLWFDEERLLAFGYALRREPHGETSGLQDPRTYNACWDIMNKLMRILSSKLNRESVQIEQSGDPGESASGEIQSLIQSLWNLLPEAWSRSAQASWLCSFQTDGIDRLRDIDHCCQLRHRDDLSNVGALARMRAIRLHVLNNPNNEAHEFLRPREDLTRLESVNNHAYGTVNGARVLVEWMHYRFEGLGVPEDQKVLLMELRAKNFGSNPKPRGLRILPCLGFVEQPPGEGRQPGYGFLYELPPTLAAGDYPVTLWQLLRQDADRSNRVYRYAPLLGRLRLAHSLASFFEALFTVGFLHESLSSRNIMFGQALDSLFASPQPWSNPYIVGFQKSRPDDDSWGTEGPSDDTTMLDYEHPDYRLSGRFVVEYDYYSLGVVLLEIGLWCPLQLWSRKNKGLAPNEFRNLLVAKYVPRLAASVGEVYRDVVRVCLDGSLERSRFEASGNDGEVFATFIDRVLTPLEQLSELRL